MPCRGGSKPPPYDSYHNRIFVYRVVNICQDDGISIKNPSGFPITIHYSPFTIHRL